MASSLLNSFNDAAKSIKFKKISDLETETIYKVDKIENIKTRYGDTILVYVTTEDLPIIFSKKFAHLGGANLEKTNAGLKETQLYFTVNDAGSINFQEEKRGRRNKI